MPESGSVAGKNNVGLLVSISFFQLMTMNSPLFRDVPRGAQCMAALSWGLCRRAIHFHRHTYLRCGVGRGRGPADLEQLAEG